MVADLMAGEELPVSFSSRGVRMFGILHRPVRGPRELAVIFLNAGLQNRAGPQRLYVKTARRLAECGLTCLRVDLPGVGESEGEDPETHFDVWNPDDVSSTIDFLGDEHAITRFVLLGLCAGGRVALKAANRDPRVDSVVAWAVPLLSGPPEMPSPPEGAGKMTKTAAVDHLRHWAPRLLNPSAWRRYFASGQTAREGVRKLRNVTAGLFADKTSRTGLLAELDSFLESGRRALFAYGDQDRTPLAEFRESYPSIAGSEDPLREFLLVENGDHTFASRGAERRVIDGTLGWLKGSYPDTAGAPATP